jgi:hypothetical protein
MPVMTFGTCRWPPSVKNYTDCLCARKGRRCLLRARAADLGPSEAPIAISERGEGRCGCLQEDRTRLRAKSVDRLQFTQRHGLKPDDINNPAQNLA